MKLPPTNRLAFISAGKTRLAEAPAVQLIISRFRSPYSDRSYIGILGPTRQSYREVMQLVRRTGEALEEALYNQPEKEGLEPRAVIDPEKENPGSFSVVTACRLMIFICVAKPDVHAKRLTQALLPKKH